MRYIYYIIIIFLGLSAIIGYQLQFKKESPEDAALIINNRIITTDEFNRLYSLRPSHMTDKDKFINSLITKELLIQESKREGIDREESFRMSIQNFYEQSLIKLLMDRKFAALDITVGDDEIKKYISLLNKQIYLTIFSFDSKEEAVEGKYSEIEKKKISFENLSDDFKFYVLPLNEGEITKPIKTEDKYMVIRLDKTESIKPGISISDTEREEIRKMLADMKKESMINDWIGELREKASIKIMIDEKK